MSENTIENAKNVLRQVLMIMDADGVDQQEVLSDMQYAVNKLQQLILLEKIQ